MASSAAVLLLVLVVLLLAIPLGVGAAMGGPCSAGSGPSCTALAAGCVAVVAALVVFGGSLLWLLGLLDPRGSALQLMRLLDRPPRVALPAP